MIVCNSSKYGDYVMLEDGAISGYFWYFKIKCNVIWTQHGDDVMLEDGAINTREVTQFTVNDTNIPDKTDDSVLECPVMKISWSNESTQNNARKILIPYYHRTTFLLAFCKINYAIFQHHCFGGGEINWFSCLHKDCTFITQQPSLFRWETISDLQQQLATDKLMLHHGFMLMILHWSAENIIKPFLWRQQPKNS